MRKKICALILIVVTLAIGAIGCGKLLAEDGTPMAGKDLAIQPDELTQPEPRPSPNTGDPGPAPID